MNEEACADQTDLTSLTPPALSLGDITEQQDGLSHSDVCQSLTNPVEDREEQEGHRGFQFDNKEEEEEKYEECESQEGMATSK